MTASASVEVPRNQVLVGDAGARLLELPDARVDCVITSPPYFGLRDYGVSAQLGLESDVDGWVANLRAVCQQLARVLKPTGCLWLNVGDGYSAHQREGAQPKSLLLGPQRLALALVSDGWIVRNQVIWHKPNALPHSVHDRLTNSHELFFLLTRQRRYYFDLDAIREPAITPAGRGRSGRAHYLPESAVPFRRRAPRIDLNHGLRALDATGRKSHPLGKNPGDVWSVATASFHGAHFATFPLRLVERPLLATCPERVCTACGVPWARTPIDRARAAHSLGALQPSCPCRADVQPGLVLDPFLGSGTVALAAEQHGRDWLGIELNPAYAALSQQRLVTQRAALAERLGDRRPERPPPARAAA